VPLYPLRLYLAAYCAMDSSLDSIQPHNWFDTVSESIFALTALCAKRLDSSLDVICAQAEVKPRWLKLNVCSRQPGLTNSGTKLSCVHWQPTTALANRQRRFRKTFLCQVSLRRMLAAFIGSPPQPLRIGSAISGILSCVRSLFDGC
jgi:hypothetical protein